MAQSKYKILIVEDNPSDRELLTGILNNMDKRFEVRSVGSYGEAKEDIRKVVPDLVLLDIYLPDKDGFHFLKEFRENGNHDIPVLLVSAFANEKDKFKGLELGATDFINKPIVAEDMKARVAVQLRLKKVMDDQNWACRKTNEGIKILYKELEKKNEALKKIDQLKSDFVSTISHELRTPLTVIKEGIDIVLDGTDGDINTDQKDHLDIAKRNVDRLARLIDSVLDYQKLQAGRIEFQMQPQDMNHLILETGAGFIQMAQKKGLEITTQLAKGLPLINCDRDKVVQVISNFLNNAIKFSEKGRITIKTETSGNIIRVAVQDEGPGIKEEDFSKLFQSFSQLLAGGARRTGGSGLGLAISKNIIEAHQGKIGVESTFGKGSTFYFILPIKERRSQSHG